MKAITVPSFASLLSGVCVAVAITCTSSPDMAVAKEPRWIESILQVRSTYGATTANSTVTWSDPEKVKVQVQLDQGGKGFTAKYVWRVGKDDATQTQSALTKLRAKRPRAKGPVRLSAGDASQVQTKDPLEISACDALIRISHLRFSEATAASSQAEKLACPNDSKAQINAIRAAIAALGDLYRSEATIDDTRMKLIIANDALEKGRNAQALALLQGVLESRLIAYRDLRKPTPAR